MEITRRTFLGGALAAIAAFRGARGQDDEAAGTRGAATLMPDPEGNLDLRSGFRYRILSRTGEPMDDGFLTPGRPDGMAALPRRDGRIALIRNHELNPSQQALSAAGSDIARLAQLGSRLYDPGGGLTPGCGATTTIILDPETRERERIFLSLAGTELNCAGGPTPWNSWLTCEEAVPLAGRADCSTTGGNWACRAIDADQSAQSMEVIRERDHGFVFEVSADADEPVRPVPLTAMGRFLHEAAAVDPRTGIVYLTEDRADGLLYRFVPDRPGSLREGGLLQALAIRGEPSRETGNARGTGRFPQGLWRPVEWITLDEVSAPANDLHARGFELGAARFTRGEGAWFAGNELAFTCTEGGRQGLGQIFRYRPSPLEGQPGEAGQPGRLMLFVEAKRESVMQYCDNLTVAPWGDLIVAEDAPRDCRLLGVRADGHIYELARHSYSDSELAGVCFAPDGSELFVNIQDQGLTLGITGPWSALSRL